MSKIMLFVLAASVYAVSLFVCVPAPYVIGMESSGLKGIVLQPEGSLWSGQGTLQLAGVPVGPIEWRIAPLALVTSGCWSAQVTLRGRGIAVVDACEDQWSIRSLELTMAASALVSRLGFHASSASGTVNAEIASMKAGVSNLGVNGEVLWHDAVAGLGVKVSLGSVAMTLSPERQHTRIEVRNEGGTLELDLLLMLDHKLNYQLSGTLKAAAAGLSLDELGIIGDRQSDGSFRIRHAGSLSH